MRWTPDWFANQTSQAVFGKGVEPLAHGTPTATQQGGDSRNRPAIGGKQDHAGTRGDLSRDRALPLLQQAPLSSSERTDVQHAFIVSSFPPFLFLKCGWSTKFSIATNRKVKNQDVTTWWNCSAWRGLAETIHQHVHKGDMLLVTGSPSLREYTTRDGRPGTSLDVLVDKFAFAGGKKGAATGAGRSSGEDEDPLGDLEDHPF
jgi:hypothetical protein